MATYDRELKYFEMKLSDNFKKIFTHNRSRSSHQKKIKNLRSQAQNEIVLGTEYLDLNNQTEPHYNEVNMHGAGNILSSSPDDYPDRELNKYFNFDSNVGANPSKEDFETRRIQSLDDFFQDFNEIISSEMKTSTLPYDQDRHSAATNNISYGDPSNAFNSNVSGADFNLDLTQFYINTNESDFLNTDDIKTDFSHGMIHFPPSQFGDKTVDDNLGFSVIDLSNAGTKMYGNASYNSTGHGAIVADHPEFSVMDHSVDQMADYSDNTKISVTTPLDQFYLDFKVNGGVVDSVTNGDNSVVTYISKDSLQSVEYINESGQTETVMYVDQQSDGTRDETNGSGITQYEIIDLNDYPYQAENGQSLQHKSNEDDVNVSNSSPVQYNDENADIGQQTDILSTLFSDRNNKITMIAKPLKNPKSKRPNDEFYLKFEEIDNNPTNIAFAKQPKVRGCRKQKLETINQIELEVVETKRGRPKVHKTVTTAVAATTTTTTTTTITETPKLPSKFMRDRRSKTQTKRKRPRKLCWDSESDCENGEKFINTE